MMSSPITLRDADLVELRTWAVDRAIQNRGGAPACDIVVQAGAFEAYVLAGAGPRVGVVQAAVDGSQAAAKEIENGGFRDARFGAVSSSLSGGNQAIDEQGIGDSRVGVAGDEIGGHTESPVGCGDATVDGAGSAVTADPDGSIRDPKDVLEAAIAAALQVSVRLAGAYGAASFEGCGGGIDGSFSFTADANDHRVTIRVDANGSTDVSITRQKSAGKA
jgi:hypothetical protein